MRIHVEQVDPTAPDGGTRVWFVSSAGAAIAMWRGSAPVVPGGRYDVELDLPFVLDRSAVGPPEERTPGIRVQGQNTVLRALVEGVEDDGVAYLRLATDCLFMAETAGTFAVGEVIQIVLSPDELLLTVTGVET